MLKDMSIFHHVERTKQKTNLYITQEEQEDLLNNLTIAEMKFYSFCKFAPAQHNYTASDFTTKGLSQHLSLSESTVGNIKSILKKKGYLLIIHFKDERGYAAARVIVGKRMVQLYNLGLNLTVLDSKEFSHQIDRVLSADGKDRSAVIKRINEEYVQ